MHVQTDIEAERGLLSTTSKDGNLVDECLDESVSAEWFTLTLHQKIWEKLKICDKASDLIDVEVQLSFKEDADRTEAGEILQSCDTSLGFRSYLDATRENFRKRKLETIQMTISDSLLYGKGSEEIISATDKSLTEISIDNVESTKTSAEVAASMWANLMERREVNGMSGIPSGLHKIDAMTYGWQKGEMTVIAARTSVGKTAFGCELTLGALKNGNKVLFFSLEMKAESVMQRLISNISEVPTQLIVEKTASDQEEERYRQAIDWVGGTDLWIDDRGMVNSAQVRAKARKLARKGLDFIVVDYCQKLSPVDPRVSREQQVAEIAGSMKALAMELDIPVILLSQLNRGADETNRKPRLSDLRESGALEQDADLVVMLWRKNDDPAETIISINKQRQGRCGDVPLCFKPNIQKFTPPPVLN